MVTEEEPVTSETQSKKAAKKAAAKAEKAAKVSYLSFFQDTLILTHFFIES